MGTEISLCMIVRDEEDTLGRCLSNAREYADEIVIVDTGSRDGTPALAVAVSCVQETSFASMSPRLMRQLPRAARVAEAK